MQRQVLHALVYLPLSRVNNHDADHFGADANQRRRET